MKLPYHVLSTYNFYATKFATSNFSYEEEKGKEQVHPSIETYLSTLNRDTLRASFN